MSKHEEIVRKKYPNAAVDVRYSDSIPRARTRWWVVLIDPAAQPPRTIAGRSRTREGAWKHAAAEVKKG